MCLCLLFSWYISTPWIQIIQSQSLSNHNIIPVDIVANAFTFLWDSLRRNSCIPSYLRSFLIHRRFAVYDASLLWPKQGALLAMPRVVIWISRVCRNLFFFLQYASTFSSRVLGTVYTYAVSFVTASLSMRLHLSFTRRWFDFVISTGSFWKGFQKWSVFKTIRFQWPCKRRNCIDLKTVWCEIGWLEKVSFSMRFPVNETVLIGNRAHVNAALVKQNHSALCELFMALSREFFFYIQKIEFFTRKWRLNLRLKNSNATRKTAE